MQQNRVKYQSEIQRRQVERSAKNKVEDVKEEE
jgi:hypothetical protein